MSGADDRPSPPKPMNRRPLDRATLSVDGVGELVLVRHGQQNFGVTGVGTDHPLTEKGERQAEAAAGALAGDPVAAVYSSTLGRARDTGVAIARRHGLEVHEIEALCEVMIFPPPRPDGTRATDDLDPLVRDGSQELFVQSRRWDAFTMGETSAEFRRRVVPAIEGILARHPAERVVVACHGGVINVYLAHVLGLAEDMFFRPAHASINRVVFDDHRRVILTLGDVHHLRVGDDDLLTR